MLTQAEVAHYLLSLGLVKPRAIVEEELVVVQAFGRNCVCIASARGCPAYVVKQAGERRGAALAHEAAVLGALAREPELAELVPSVVHHDADAALLVLSTPAGAHNWSEHHARGRFAPAPARALGRALAAVHRLQADQVEFLPPGSDALWGLSLPEPPHDLVLELSAAATDLLARLQADKFLCGRLRDLRSVGSDGADVLLHGDLRWENCLLVARPGARRRTRVLLVDWELTGRGPPAIDVGTVLAEYVCRWIASIPMLDPRDPGRFMHHAHYPLGLMRPALQAFWSAYRSANTRPAPVALVLELAAVRLVQAAIERAQDQLVASAHTVALLQLAENLLRDPELAAFGLLGLR